MNVLMMPFLPTNKNGQKTNCVLFGRHARPNISRRLPEERHLASGSVSQKCLRSRPECEVQLRREIIFNGGAEKTVLPKESSGFWLSELLREFPVDCIGVIPDHGASVIHLSFA